MRCHALELLSLIQLWVIGSSKQIIHRNVVEICEFGKGHCGNVDISPLVIAVYSLAAGEDLSHFRLGQILVFS